MPHLESKTKLIMTASVNKYINPKKIESLRLYFLCSKSFKVLKVEGFRSISPRCL